VSDVATALARFGHRYRTRLFTAAEGACCCADDARTAERFAARFAAKEATLKVLRPAPHDGIAWRSIEVRQLPAGACEIQLHGSALELARRDGIAELSVSMSHEGGYAIATVVARLAPPSGRDRTDRFADVPAAPRSGTPHRQSSWDA
jgi:holo-[acyl-carrier protein] synthase